jgi:hypothetical protein
VPKIALPAVGLALLLAAAAPAAAAPVGLETRANTTTAGNQFDPAVAQAANGGLVVVWIDDGAIPGIYGQRYDAGGAAVGGQFRVDTGAFAASDQLSPAVAMDADGDFVVVWEAFVDRGDGDPEVDSYSVLARRFSSNGLPAGTETRVPATTPATGGAQFAADVAMEDDGSYVIAWTGAEDQDSEAEIYARRFGPSGTPIGTEFQVNTTTENEQSSPAVAMDGDGDFVVAWSSYLKDGDEFGVAFRQFGSDGTSAAERQANLFGTGNQYEPDVAMDADGDFVLTWTSEAGMQDGDRSGIYARSFTAAGAGGTEIQVNTTTADIQESSAVETEPNGKLVVTWQSLGQDGSGNGVFARRFNAPEAPPNPPVPPQGPEGAEFKVNTFTTDHQHAPAIAMSSTEEFVVAWNSFGQDGSTNPSDGVFLQRYAPAPGATTEPPTDSGGAGAGGVPGGGSGAGGGSAGGGSGAGSVFGLAGIDTSGPVLTLGVARQRLGRVMRSGLRHTAGCSEACALRSRIVLGHRALGSAAKSLAAAGRTSITVRLTRTARRRLLRMRRVTLTLRVQAQDPAGNTTTVSRRVAVRR